MATEDVARESSDDSKRQAENVRSNEDSPDQDRLIADVLAGDRKAIATLVERTADAVYGFVSRRIDRQEIVEELCQEVFLAAWPQLERFRKEASLTTWLCAIARHKVADFYRRRLREATQEKTKEEDDAGYPESVQVVDFEAHIDGQRVGVKTRKILSQMSERHRSTLRWRYWDDRSLGEIAEMTGKTEKSVERLLARSRADFAQRWNRD